MNLVVTGTRENHPRVWVSLDYMLNAVMYVGIENVILGDAKGVDTKAKEWCISNNIPYKVHRADWQTYGKMAGILRNANMVAAANAGDWCLALPGPNSVGTWDCVKRASQAGLSVLILPWDGQQ